MQLSLNEEWGFISSEINVGAFRNTNIKKRQILFALQIILSRINLLKNEIERGFLIEKYFGLKKVYVLD